MVKQMNVNVDEVLTYKWLAPITLALAISLMGYGMRSVIAEQLSASVERQEMKVAIADQRSAAALKIQALEIQLVDIQKSQEREHRLLVKIARRMGLEVAD